MQDNFSFLFNFIFTTSFIHSIPLVYQQLAHPDITLKMRKSLSAMRLTTTDYS
ncbi:hypothetical protein FC26_GL001671 [Paucilactobacillus vaccinostercus DSM 20634]|uniref:Uncharacterized protein n=1 Tax=Paucilactobacillus vaccinostercus DSM 20634 TaxID=1423813 RepID=A0A0R2AFN9_9LACO|nr:hypothetical protein FC26_GL001671 [Paucilactobacillus vaccinostercus DSM 20634]